MKRKIIIYGMGEFPEPDELRRYIETDVFNKDLGRFDYPRRKDADVIVLSLAGLAYGHFEIASKVKPTDDELIRLLRARAIYIVKQPTSLYQTPVKLLPLGIRGIQFGKPISEEQFQQIQARSGERSIS